jgi:hypothetical protein
MPPQDRRFFRHFCASRNPGLSISSELRPLPESAPNMQKYGEIWCHGCALRLAGLIRAGTCLAARPPHQVSLTKRYPSAMGQYSAGTDESRKADRIRGTSGYISYITYATPGSGRAFGRVPASSPHSHLNCRPSGQLLVKSPQLSYNCCASFPDRFDSRFSSARAFRRLSTC